VPAYRALIEMERNVSVPIRWADIETPFRDAARQVITGR